MAEAQRPYDGKWTKLDRGRRLLLVAHAVGAAALLVVAILAVVSPEDMFRFGSVLVAVIAIAGGAAFTGLYRTMEFRCPRCSERFHQASDILGWSMFTRQTCQNCGLRYAVRSEQ